MLLEDELRSASDERDDHTHAALPEQHLGVDAGSRLASGVQARGGNGEALSRSESRSGLLTMKAARRRGGLAARAEARIQSRLATSMTSAGRAPSPRDST